MRPGNGAAKAARPDEASRVAKSSMSVRDGTLRRWWPPIYLFEPHACEFIRMDPFGVAPQFSAQRRPEEETSQAPNRPD